jgi:hypothetical protein
VGIYFLFATDINAQNILINSDFSTNEQTGWSVSRTTQPNRDATINISNGVVSFTDFVGTPDRGFQYVFRQVLNTSQLNAINNEERYTLTFDGSANEANRPVRMVFVQVVEGNFGTYGEVRANLTTSMETYSVNFTMNKRNNASQTYVGVELGESNVDVNLDNIELVYNPVPDPNILVNGDFSAATLEPWETFIEEGVSANITRQNQQANITQISGVTDQARHIQLFQPLSTEQIDRLEVDKVYTISFDARSGNGDRDLKIFFGQNETPFTAIYEHNLTLGRDFENYSFPFLMSEVFEVMKFGFEMGTSTDPVFIDNVKLEKGGKLPPPPSDENIAKNGSFEDFALGVIQNNTSNWTFNRAIGGPPSNATFEVVEDAQEGEKSMKLNVGNYNGQQDFHVEAVNEGLVVQEGITYEATVWLKADTDSRIARLYFGLPESGNYARFSQTDVSLTTSWQQYTITHTATRNDVINTMRLGLTFNLQQNDRAVIYIDNLVVKDAAAVSNEEEERPLTFNLLQNYPNPFNPSTNIGFELQQASMVTLKVYDMMGREVASLLNNQQFSAGEQRVSFSAANLSSGVYIYRLESQGVVLSRKMTLIK